MPHQIIKPRIARDSLPDQPPSKPSRAVQEFALAMTKSSLNAMVILLILVEDENNITQHDLQRAWATLDVANYYLSRALKHIETHFGAAFQRDSCISIWQTALAPHREYIQQVIEDSWTNNEGRSGFRYRTIISDKHRLLTALQEQNNQ